MKELLWSFHTIREIKVQGFIILSRSGSTFLRSRALSTPLVCSVVLPLTFANFTNWGIRLIPVGHLKLAHFTVIQRRLDYYCHIFVVTCLVFIPFANGQWFSTKSNCLLLFPNQWSTYHISIWVFESSHLKSSNLLRFQWKLGQPPAFDIIFCYRSKPVLGFATCNRNLQNMKFGILGKKLKTVIKWE